MSQPVLVRHRVVVEEGDDVTGRRLHAGILSTGKALLVTVLDHRDVRQRAAQPVEEVDVVVDDDDDLLRRSRLAAHRLHGGNRVVPAVERVCADHHGNGVRRDGIGHEIPLLLVGSVFTRHGVRPV
jgi:hypothetical protein